MKISSPKAINWTLKQYGYTHSSDINTICMKDAEIVVMICVKMSHTPSAVMDRKIVKIRPKKVVQVDAVRELTALSSTGPSFLRQST
jgi:hypothetical protein